MLGLEFLLLALVLDNNHWLLVSSWLDLEWPELDISLDGLVREFSTDESLGIEDGVQWISGGLIFGGISNESLIFGEGNVRWSGVEALIVCDDFDLIVEPYSNTGVSGSKINSDCGVFRHVFSIVCF